MVAHAHIMRVRAGRAFLGSFWVVLGRFGSVGSFENAYNNTKHKRHFYWCSRRSSAAPQQRPGIVFSIIKPVLLLASRLSRLSRLSLLPW